MEFKLNSQKSCLFSLSDVAQFQSPTHVKKTFSHWVLVLEN